MVDEDEFPKYELFQWSYTHKMGVGPTLVLLMLGGENLRLRRLNYKKMLLLAQRTDNESTSNTNSQSNEALEQALYATGEVRSNVYFNSKFYSTDDRGLIVPKKLGKKAIQRAFTGMRFYSTKSGDNKSSWVSENSNVNNTAIKDFVTLAKL